MSSACKTKDPKDRSLWWFTDPDRLIDPKTGNRIIFCEYQDKVVELRSVPREGDKGQILFCSHNGRVAGIMYPNGKLKPHGSSSLLYPNSKHNWKGKLDYLQYMHIYGQNKHILVSHAVYLAWVGLIPEDKPYIDHRNGCTNDNDYHNLEPVTRQENVWRAFRVLRPLRAKGIDPSAYTGSQMPHWFDIMRFLDKEIPLHAQTFLKEDYLRWFAMPFDEFKTHITRSLGTRISPEQMMEESFYNKE